MKHFIIFLALIFSCGKRDLTNKLKVDRNKSAEKGRLRVDIARNNISKYIWRLSLEFVEVKKDKETDENIKKKQEEARNKLKNMGKAFLEKEAKLSDGKLMYIPLFEAINRKSPEAVYLLYRRYTELGYDFNKEWNIGRSEKYTFFRYLRKCLKKGLNGYDMLKPALVNKNSDFVKILIDAGLEM